MISAPTLCLNMIVKDESHIIEKTLNNLCDKFKFDYWVISDTGSSDSTVEIIEKFFREKNISGEIHHDEWKNFAYNRNLALEYAFGKTDLLLIFDADDEVVGVPIIYYSPEIHGYKMTFKSPSIEYQRICLINNKKIWRYKSVLHEYIYCTEPDQKIGLVTGDYWLVSGRSGSRNKDPNKYLKDALLLESAYHEEKKSNGELIGRYAFYCANSYRDANDILKSIEWYKINLKEEKSGWIQEKYISCLELYRQFSKLEKQNEGIAYLIESYKYDKERYECIYELIKHYCCKDMNDIAMGFFRLLNYKDNINTLDKLFFEYNTHNFYLPYYMIIVADRLKDRKIGISMYRKIFSSKPSVFAEWWLGNLIFNFQFFVDEIPENEKKEFSTLANEYIRFLHTNNVPLNKFNILKKYTNIISVDYIFGDMQEITKQKCINSKNILVYTGFSNEPWNYTFLTNNAIGGSEKAVAYLTKYFPKSYNIYISGGVKEEKIDNITWVPLCELKNLVEKEFFNTLIISRYVSFYEMFPETKFFQSYIWAHDMYLLPYGSSLSSEEIIAKHNEKINGCVCLTEFHKEEFVRKYPCLREKIKLINNGIICENFDYSLNKIKNRFIYSSCVERGLEIIVRLWSDLISKIPDATLVIATYNKFPKENNQFEAKLSEEICKYPSISFLGKLNTLELYKEMACSEFWLYPCTFPETSCITALEILMSGVIPIYYPYAALPYTLKDNGIKTSPGNEIACILSLTEDEKNSLVKKGREYAQTCSWESRAKEWEKILFKETNYSIQIVNLKKREDRKNDMIKKLKSQNITNYSFFKAVYGKELEPTEYIKNLFRNNDFDYRKGVIGCAMSHIKLYEQLLNDNQNDLYVILEDDIEFTDNFMEKLEYCVNTCAKLSHDYTFIGGNTIKDKNSNINSLIISEITLSYFHPNKSNGTFGYIISKNGAKKILDYSNKYGIQWAIDKPDIFFNSIKNIHTVNEYLVKAYIASKINNKDTDIQSDCDKFVFESNVNNKIVTQKNNVFLYWVGNEPTLIKILRNLIYLHSTNGNGYTVHLINHDNIKQYIDILPEYFYILCPAHQADYVRVNVLCDYGGLWLDSDTIVIESLDNLFDIINKQNGFFIKENNCILWNGIFGSKPQTSLMLEWKQKMQNILDIKKNTISWAEIGCDMLQSIFNNNNKLFDNYKIFNGLDTMYPVNWNNCVEEFINKPYDNYKNIVRSYQPLLVLVNSVYKNLEEKEVSEIINGNIPLNYFINLSYNNLSIQKNKMINNFDIYNYGTNDYISNSIINYKCWEPTITNIFKSILNNNNYTVIDVGSNIGYYTLLSSKYAEKVYSIDGYNKNIELINNSILFNNLKNIFVHNVCIAEIDNLNYQFKNFDIVKNNGNIGGLSFTTDLNNNYNSIKTITLDNFIKNNKIEKIAILKIDIEGGELNALKGCKKTLSTNIIDNIIIEISPKFNDDSYEILSILQNNNFKLYNIPLVETGIFNENENMINNIIVNNEIININNYLDKIKEQTNVLAIKNKIEKIVIITDWIENYITMEPYLFCKNLEKIGWKIIKPSQLKISELNNTNKKYILCVTYDDFDIKLIKNNNNKIIYKIDDLYPFKSIRKNNMINSDIIIGPYEYLFKNLDDINIENLKTKWIPYSAVDEYFKNIDFNKTPIKKVFISGALGDCYPLRNFIYNNNIFNNYIEKLEHPTYNLDNLKHSCINEKYYSKLNEYLCCFCDSLIYNYTLLKIFEITACGSLLLVSDKIEKILNQLGFYDKVNCIFCNENNLLDKIQWILDENNIDQVDKIRFNGMLLTRNNHTTTLRAKELNDYINNINFDNDDSICNNTNNLNKEIFTNIYKNGIWNNNDSNIPLSGPGSSLEATSDILSIIDNFIDDNKIKTIIDLGCGDLTWIPKSKFFNDSNISYTGIDIVNFLIESHKSKYPTKNFDCQDITEYKFKKEYDLIILRDVIFHLKNEQIIEIFKNIEGKFKYIGITTCTNKINLNEFDKWNYSQKNIHIEPFNIIDNSILNIYEPKFNRYFKIFNSFKINETDSV